MTNGFRALADVLAQAEDGGRTDVMEVSARWQAPAPVSAGEDIVWGRLPAAGLSPIAAVAFAIRRELALAALRRGVGSGLHVRRVHRLAPARHAGRIRGAVRSVLLQGAAAELTRTPWVSRAYERVLGEAGVKARAVSLHVSRDGSVRVAGSVREGPVILRMASVRAGTDPRRAAEALRVLEERSMSGVPRLIRAGGSGHLAWTVETRLAGQVPHQFGDALWADVVPFASRLKNVDGRPITAVRRHLEIIEGAMPNGTAHVRAVAEGLEEGLRDMPSVLEHGDMCRDNILVDHDSFSGVVDWDTWHPAGVPGVDLLELYATERMRRTPTDIGSLVLGRVWDEPDFRRLTDEYWPAIGVTPASSTVRTIGIAWWLSTLAGLLDRPDRRHLAQRPEWVGRNVDTVASWLQSGQQ